MDSPNEMDKSVSTIDLLESLSVLKGSSSERISRTVTIFKQICRTCLNEIADEGQSNNVFIPNDSDGSAMSIKDKLQLLTGMKICAEDRLPKIICNGCLKLIDSAFSFRVHTQRVDDILKRFIRKIYNSKEETSTGSSIQTVGSSEKINNPLAAIEVGGYGRSFVHESGDYECVQCKQIFSSEVDLDKHASKHRKQIDRRSYDCGICSKKFKFHNGLLNHLQIAHKQKKDYKCTRVLYTNRDRFRHYTERPCTIPNAALTETSQITIYPIGEWMTAENIHVEIMNLSCSLCNEKFEKEADFLSHLQKHSVIKNCPYCKKYVNRIYSLESHVRSHTNERPFVCPLCSKRFLASRTFRKHLILHTKKESHECAKCGNIFSSESELIKHLSRHPHVPVSLLENDNCEEEIKPNDIKKGENNCLASNPRNATDLAITQSMDSELTKVDFNHKSEIETKASNENFALSSAKSEADTSMDFTPSGEEIIIKNEIIEDQSASSDEHIESASNQAVWNLESTPAGFDNIAKEEYTAYEVANEPLSDDESPAISFTQDSTGNKQSLEYSYEYGNYKKKIIDDDNCSDYKTKNRPQFFLKFLDDSIKESQPQCYTSFICVIEECKMEFKYYRDIVNHYTSQHCQGPPPLKCPVCSETFPLKQNVRTHLKTHLSCEYKCPHCPKGYWQQRDLRIHLRTHTGERPFKCIKCSKMFKQRNALKAHIKTHNLCKEFKCNFCPKEYFSYNGLFLHQNTHKKIKELMCKFCCKQFGSKHLLQRHQSGVCAIRDGVEKNVITVS